MDSFLEKVSWDKLRPGDFLLQEDFGLCMKIEPVEIKWEDYDGDYNAVCVDDGIFVFIESGEYGKVSPHFVVEVARPR